MTDEPASDPSHALAKTQTPTDVARLTDGSEGGPDRALAEVGTSPEAVDSLAAKLTEVVVHSGHQQSGLSLSPLPLPQMLRAYHEHDPKVHDLVLSMVQDEQQFRRREQIADSRQLRALALRREDRADRSLAFEHRARVVGMVVGACLTASVAVACILVGNITLGIGLFVASAGLGVGGSILRAVLKPSDELDDDLDDDDRSNEADDPGKR